MRKDDLDKEINVVESLLIRLRQDKRRRKAMPPLAQHYIPIKAHGIETFIPLEIDAGPAADAGPAKAGVVNSE